MLQIKTNKRINAVIEAPPSKSYTNRALIIASLAKGKSIIRNPLISDDTNYMISALNEFGIGIKKKGSDLTVNGTGGNLKTPKRQLYTGNAGTTMRFITSLSALCEHDSMISGDKRMQERPIKDLLDALEMLGVRSKSNNGFPPVKIFGGTFKGGKIKLRGSTSSQYLSSILMCAPYAKDDTIIELSDNLTSKPYVDVTIDIMKNFGVKIVNKNYKKLIIKTNRQYKPKDYRIEGDASNASYFLAAAAITKGKVNVKGLNPKSKQGDIKFIEILRKMGCKIKTGRDFVEIVGGRLKGIDADMNSMPDLVPTVAVMALFADGETKIRNVQNLRVKETDRLRALAFELRKIGANVEETADGLKIRKRRYQKAVIETYGDHRIAMSFAVAGLVISGIRIINPSCVNKSFPEFWKRFEELY